MCECNHVHRRASSRLGLVPKTGSTAFNNPQTDPGYVESIAPVRIYTPAIASTIDSRKGVYTLNNTFCCAYNMCIVDSVCAMQRKVGGDAVNIHWLIFIACLIITSHE